MSSDYTIDELMATFISRQMHDDELVIVGANQPIPRAGVMQAYLLRCPNLKVPMYFYMTDMAREKQLQLYPLFADGRYRRWAEGYFTFEMQLESARKADVCFIGGIQVDQYGNTNLIGIKGKEGNFKLRGPGSAGTPTTSSYIKRYYILMGSHNPRVFVKRCDYVSAVGWHNGGADARRALGLPGGGPKYVISPFGIMDFEEETKKMRLKAVYPGVDPDQVVRNTGFELIMHEQVEVVSPPNEDELRVLRGRVDPQGILRK
ncbi:hypothetical protein MFMK1_002648 [Metallumcola ferriviriculae]|uniref:Glutaconate CoA-transferase n=1 Tax=Metallumcola ferriviriculae TaxID=3039180 RepID=A0AAU0URG6_9FIRM|nr:hypothetical protein MFMK1_002648 [Desulfitibacteraceae bacterium MK1]